MHHIAPSRIKCFNSPFHMFRSQTCMKRGVVPFSLQMSNASGIWRCENQFINNSTCHKSEKRLPINWVMMSTENSSTLCFSLGLHQDTATGSLRQHLQKRCCHQPERKAFVCCFLSTHHSCDVRHSYLPPLFSVKFREVQLGYKCRWASRWRPRSLDLLDAWCTDVWRGPNLFRPNPHWTRARKFERKIFDVASVQCGHSHSHQQAPFACVARERPVWMRSYGKLDPLVIRFSPCSRCLHLCVHIWETGTIFDEHSIEGIPPVWKCSHQSINKLLRPVPHVLYETAIDQKRDFFGRYICSKIM